MFTFPRVHISKSSSHLSYREIKIRTIALWAIFTTNWNLPRFSPTCFARRKVREISICCRNCSQGRCSYFDFTIDKIIFNGTNRSQHWIDLCCWRLTCMDNMQQIADALQKNNDDGCCLFSERTIPFNYS